MTLTRELCKQVDSYCKTPSIGRSANYADHLAKEVGKKKESVRAAITTLQSELQELELAGEKLYDLLEVE